MLMHPAWRRCESSEYPDFLRFRALPDERLIA